MRRPRRLDGNMFRLTGHGARFWKRARGWPVFTELEVSDPALHYQSGREDRGHLHGIRPLPHSSGRGQINLTQGGAPRPPRGRRTLDNLATILALGSRPPDGQACDLRY